VDPQGVCVIWRRKDGCWDYLCRAPFFDVERIVWLDQSAEGTTLEQYQVRKG
jgi:hypothetical protein